MFRSACFVAAVFFSCHAAPGELPSVRVENLRRAYHDGHHNAFTDLCRFQGNYFLTFRSCPDGHGVHPTSSIIVLSSRDAIHWEVVHRFHVELRDVRDPHFLVFRDRLFVYTGAWFTGESSPARYEMNDHLGFAAWTDDGDQWHGPKMLEGTYGHYVWRAATYGEQAYLCGRRKRDFLPSNSREERDALVESALLVSSDGLIWKTCGRFQEQYGDETAFLFDEDGRITAVARSGGGRNAQVCRSRPPYQTFDRVELDRYIGGPLLVAWHDHLLVGGRNTKDGPARTSFYWLADDSLHEVATLPSGGDNSYPGFVELDENRALVSYYSSHERDEDGNVITAIYLADFVIAED